MLGPRKAFSWRLLKRAGRNEAFFFSTRPARAFTPRTKKKKKGGNWGAVRVSIGLFEAA